MSKIDALIKELCPEGVKFKKLGDCITKNIGGGTPSKAVPKYWRGSIPWASVGDLSIDGLFIESTRNFITEEGLKKSSSHIVPKNSVIVAVKIAPGKMVIAGKDIAINQDLRGLQLCKFLNNKFLTYYFQVITIIGNGTIVKGVTVNFLEKIRIPVPPLPVQEEIVKILDTFARLEAKLEAELKAELVTRKKQYEHCRNKLLTFKETI